MPDHDLDLTRDASGPDDPVTAALTDAVATLTPARTPPFEAVLARRRRRHHRRIAATGAAAAVLATGTAIALPQLREQEPRQVAGPAATASPSRPALLSDVAGSVSGGVCVDRRMTAAERDLRDIWTAALREVTREGGSRWTPAQLNRDTGPTPPPETWAVQQFRVPVPGPVHACLTSGIPGVLPIGPATDGTRAVDRRGYLGGYLVRVTLPSGRGDTRQVSASVIRGPGSEDFHAWIWQVERKPSGWTVTKVLGRAIG